MSMGRLEEIVNQSNIYFTYHHLPFDFNSQQVFLLDSSVFEDDLICREFLARLKDESIVIASDSAIAHLERFVHPEQSIMFRPKSSFSYPADEEIIIMLRMSAQDKRHSNLKLENSNVGKSLSCSDLGRAIDPAGLLHAYENEVNSMDHSISSSSIVSVYLSPESIKKEKILKSYSIFVTPFNAGNQLKTAFALKPKL